MIPTLAYTTRGFGGNILAVTSRTSSTPTSLSPEPSPEPLSNSGSSSALGVGQVVGNYKITAKIGEGGMGVVFLAEHPVIGKKVALKVIHPDLARNPEVVSRFVMEAKAVNQIGHEHIVDIGDFGNTANGEFYFIMEYLQGESLADRLKREACLSQARALAVGAQIADALGASHDQGIIHRDLKPENIFLISRGGDPDFVKVLDFDLAKLTQVEEKVTHKTRAGSVMGTPYYMSPEQGEGKIESDHRADIYSLGILLFEMLTGKVPFGGEGYGEIIVKHITHQAPSARKINPAISAAVEMVLYRALAKERDSRFQTMHEFREALLDPEGYLAGSPSLTVPPELTSVNRMAAPMSRKEMPFGYRDNMLTPLPAGRETGAGDDHSGMESPTPPPASLRHGVSPVPIGAFEDAAPPSLKPAGVNGKMVLGVLAGVAAAVLGLAGVARLMRDDRPRAFSEASAQTVRATAKPPATVKLSFASDPAGATVVRLSDNKELGLTPLVWDQPYSEAPEKFVLRMAGYDDKTLLVVPNLPVPLFVSLQASPKTAEAGEPAAGVAGAQAGSRTRHRPFGRRAGSRGDHPPADATKTEHRTMPLDRDAVLEPDFK